MNSGRSLPILVLTLALAAAGPVPVGAGAEATPVALAGYEPSDAELTGRDIYQRVLDNRFDSYVQDSVLLSGDEAGNVQKMKLRMWFQSLRGEERSSPEGGPLSKTLVKYTHPFDIRHSGYLVIHNLDRPSDQFVYLASHRTVRRVNLRGEAVFGTDFSFEDVVPKEIESAEYERMADQDLDGAPCFLIEATPTPEAHSEYSRFQIYVEKERSVPLRTRYWDDRDVEVKELRVARDAVERINGVWVPRHMKMRNLRLKSYTELVVEEIEPNRNLPRKTFDLRRLEGR